MTVRDANDKVVLETLCIGTNFIQDVGAACQNNGIDELWKTCEVNLPDGSYIECYFGEGLDHGTCQFAEGWRCAVETGSYNKFFAYSGGSQVTVEVDPNCSETPNTEWLFEVRCQ